ncbi:hypothetical protein [Streptomyces sp. BBFR102]|uniref:hypothetical protein n=1 Tax=Streptomyces sp. BBFR102 TaxID=3448171 RepID=UPI003F52D03C
MHAYDPSRSRPLPPSSIPSMRPARDLIDGRSSTPIYDALYAEYRRSFRALPGDRSGEEDLRFHAFGGPHGLRRPPQEPHPGHEERAGGSWTPPSRRHAAPALPPAPPRWERQ